ncbi:MAG: hypothetical protein GX804_11200, partial [Lentisphaerae bacterium]|nr:hypothetical protein [Lentisphaerota bacterium]
MSEIKPIREKWRGKTSGRERFNKQMNFQSPDRSFNMEFGYWDENFGIWEMFRRNNIKNNYEADIFFNFDRISVIGGNTWMQPHFPHTVLERKAESE